MDSKSIVRAALPFQAHLFPRWERSTISIWIDKRWLVNDERVLKCHPLHRDGNDPVPPKQNDHNREH